MLDTGSFFIGVVFCLFSIGLPVVLFVVVLKNTNEIDSGSDIKHTQEGAPNVRVCSCSRGVVVRNGDPIYRCHKCGGYLPLCASSVWDSGDRILVFDDQDKSKTTPGRPRTKVSGR